MHLSLVRAVRIASATCGSLMAGISLFLLPLPAWAKAPAEFGPTSSASIEISVSIAPRYRLQLVTGAPDQSHSPGALPAAFCIAGNGAAMTLPAELVWAAPVGHGEREREAAASRMPIAWCEALQHSAAALPMLPPQRGIELLIVRPE